MKRGNHRMSKAWKYALATSLLTLGVNAGGWQAQKAEAAPTVVNLDGTTVGRTYEGVGAVFSNGMTKLLMDYPENQRNDILDLLFKPKFGASLQHVKIEIGTDVNSSAGTEPSHMRSETDIDITRGSGLWLAAQAKALNDDIELEALRWGTPRWITDANGVAKHDESLDYYLTFLEGARDVYGLEFDYLGPDKNEHTLQSEWNPTYNPASSPTNGRARDFVVNVLRPGLDANGFADVELVAADSNTGWWIADKAAADPGLADALDVLNVHYIQDSTATAKSLGKRLWAGEDLAPLRYDFVKGSLDMAYRIMRMYTVGKLTKYEMHPAIESSYPTTPFNTKSILVANTPWSGHYEILKGLWVTAHFTQFTEIGWKYIDSGNAIDARGGYTLLKHPATGDWSLIVLNLSSAPKEYVFNLSGGLSTGRVYAWKTTDDEQFVQEPYIDPVGGSFGVTVEPYSIYTFTTTTGQQKGAPAHSIPASGAFPLTTPYSDIFFDDFVGQMSGVPSPDWLVFTDPGTSANVYTDGTGKKWIKLEDTVSGSVPSSNRAVLDRKFARASGKLVWEFEYMRPEPQGQWIRLALSNNGTDAIQLFDTNTAEAFAYIKPDGSRGKIADLTPGATHLIRIEADTDTDTFDAYVDGLLKVQNAPFKTAVPHVDRMHVETPGTNAATATGYLDNIRLQGEARSLETTVRDVFNEFPNGTKAKEYRSTTPTDLQQLDWSFQKTSAVSSDVCEIAPTPSASDKSFKCVDSSSSGNVNLTRDWGRVDSGLVTIEFKFMQNAAQRWTRFFVGNDTETLIELYDTSSDGFAFKTGPDSAPYVSLGTVTANTWHKVKLAIDMDDRTFDAWFDGVAALKDQPFTETSWSALNNLKIRTGDSPTVTLYVDDVRVTVERP